MSHNCDKAGFLLIAHGSRRKASNSEVEMLASMLQTQLASPVEPAFLELTQPDFEQALQALVKSGCTRVRVIPYFLAAGRHLVDDLPGKLNLARQRYPQLTLEATDYIGASAGMLALLSELALAAHVEPVKPQE